MATEIQALTAGECAGNLVAALMKGSRAGIQRAFEEARYVAGEPSRDTLEDEYRELLAGILGAMPTSEHNHRTVVRLLRHVAANAPQAVKYPRQPRIPAALVFAVC